MFVVVICFQISIFEPLETTPTCFTFRALALWFAFKLVSLNHWKQLCKDYDGKHEVVICFQISIFEPLETTSTDSMSCKTMLWFAFKLVSLNHWKQRKYRPSCNAPVVICFQISIFEPLETTQLVCNGARRKLWFAFKLVSLNHWKQPHVDLPTVGVRCDLLSN